MDASIIKKHRRLAEQLWARTKTDDPIEWKESGFGPGYETNAGQYIIGIKERSGNFDAPDYVVTLYDHSYDVIDSFSDEEIFEESAKPAVGNSNGYYSLLEDLFRTAQRNSKGADKALDSVLAFLDDDIPF